MNVASVTAPARPLSMPRRFAILLLHEAQLAGAEGFVAAIGAAAVPDTYWPLDGAAGVGASLDDAESRFAAQSRTLWALYLHRPGALGEPTAADFFFRPGLLRLTSSLATKGVLQLRAWTYVHRFDAPVFDEVELQIHD